MHKDLQFQQEILYKFRASVAGDKIRENELIQHFGYRMFNLHRHDASKFDEMHKRVMTEMRTLTRVFIKFQDFAAEPTTIKDLFTRKHLQSLKLAMTAMGEGVDPNAEIKYGMTLNANSIG